MTPLFGQGLLDGRIGGPLYRRLQSGIRRAIDEGRLRPADALPSERDMANGVGVSRVTIRKAIQGLVAEGVIRQRHGSGTFVAERGGRVQQGLSHLTSFTEDMRARGSRATSRWLERTLGRVSPEEAMHLALSPGEPVARFVRLRMADGVPMAIERAVIPASILPDPDAVGSSLYQALGEAGHRPVRALQRLSAENLKPGDAELLELEAGAAALSILRVSYDESGIALEHTRSHYRGDAYDFVAELALSDEG